MGNLTHYTGSNNATPLNGNDSPGDTPDHGGGAADGYASEDFVTGSSSSRERKKGSIFDVCVLEFSFLGFVFHFLIQFCVL